MPRNLILYWWRLARLQLRSMNRKSDISPEDTALFRDAVDGIVRLPASERKPRRTPAPSARPLQSEHDQRAVMESLLDHPLELDSLETGEALEFRQHGVQLSVMRKLRRGQYTRQAELDLHGLSVAQARAGLAAFLARARRHNFRCIRVIHGKGLRSRNGQSVLKPKVASWLRHCQDVLAYCSAIPADGGGGALYVLLKSSSGRP